jgi:translocation and assembly module TamA
LKRLRVAAAAGAATGILAAAAGAAWADEPKARILGVADSRLRQEIERAVGAARNPPQSRFEARRRAAAAADDVVSVLRSEGYYEPVAEPDVGEGDQPQSVVRVTIGPRFAFSSPKVSWVGDEPAPVAKLAAESAIGLTLGGPGRAVDVLAAEGRVVAAVQKRGYADAKADPREVTVDHIPRTVQPTFRIDAGDRVRLDGVKLNSQGRTHAAWVKSLAPWKSGDIYDPDQVAQLEKRLRDTSVFDSVTVALDPKPDADGNRPVDVTLVDRPKSTLELSASYSTAEGAGVDAKWVRYNSFGRGDTLTYSLQAADILSQAGIELDLPNWLSAQRTLKLSTSIYRDNTNAYLETGARIGADLEQRFGRNDFFSYGVTLVGSRDDEPQAINGALIKRVRPLETIITSSSITLDHSNDILNPTQGWRAAVTAEPSFSFGDGPIDYVRAQIQTSGYLPLTAGAATVLAGRLRIGDIFNGGIPGIPASRRFYSGGGGSVRGYGYQDVGPRFPDNTPQGGISLIETSFELRQKVVGPFGVVAFVDSGVLGSKETFDLQTVETGVGFGVRYDLGFAPFRADIAFPLERRSGDASVQIYLSIGQSF